MTKQQTESSELPTLAVIERRLAVLHQERKFHPKAPFWVLLTDAEIKALGTEEKK